MPAQTVALGNRPPAATPAIRMPSATTCPGPPIRKVSRYSAGTNEMSPAISGRDIIHPSKPVRARPPAANVPPVNATVGPAPLTPSQRSRELTVAV